MRRTVDALYAGPADTLATEIQKLGVRGVEPSELTRLIGIVLQACDAVAESHAYGAFHGGLSPCCVELDSDGEVSVGSGAGPSARGLCVAFYSTEQAWGRSADIDARTDVYAIGGMLFAIMTQHAPHEHEGDARLELASARLGLVPGLQELRERHLPWDLCRIATRALAASPSERYPSIALLKQDLERFVHSWDSAVPAPARHPSVSNECVASSVPA